MRTQTPAGPKPEMLTLKNILVPLNFLPISTTTGNKEPIMKTTGESLATRVALHPFLFGMKPRQLALLTSCATTVQFNTGQVICREGELADRLYLIETGNVILESSAGPSDPLLGCSWMFPPHTWSFSARAVAPTTAIFFDAATLREYCERDHSLGYELLKRMSSMIYQRLRAARNAMPSMIHRHHILSPSGPFPFPNPKLVPYPGTSDDRPCCAQVG